MPRSLHRGRGCPQGPGAGRLAGHSGPMHRAPRRRVSREQRAAVGGGAGRRPRGRRAPSRPARRGREPRRRALRGRCRAMDRRRPHTVVIGTGRLSVEGARWRARVGVRGGGSARRDQRPARGWTDRVHQPDGRRERPDGASTSVDQRRRGPPTRRAIGPLVGAGMPAGPPEWPHDQGGGWARRPTARQLADPVSGLQQRLTGPDRLLAAWACATQPATAPPRRRHPRRVRRRPVAGQSSTSAACAAEPGCLRRAARWSAAAAVGGSTSTWRGRTSGSVVEIDGGHHALALNPVDDALRPERGHPGWRRGAADPGARACGYARGRSWPRSSVPTALHAGRRRDSRASDARARACRALCIAGRRRVGSGGAQGAGELGDGAAGAHALGLEAVVRAPVGAARPRRRPTGRGGPAGCGRGRRTRRCRWRSRSTPPGASREATQVEGVLLHEPPLRVLVLRPRVGEEQVHRRQRRRGHPVGEERHRVAGVHPEVARPRPRRRRRASGPPRARAPRRRPGRPRGGPRSRRSRRRRGPSRSRARPARPARRRPRGTKRPVGQRARGQQGRHPLVGQRAVAPAGGEGAHALTGSVVEHRVGRHGQGPLGRGQSRRTASAARSSSSPERADSHTSRATSPSPSTDIAATPSIRSMPSVRSRPRASMTPSE